MSLDPSKGVAGIVVVSASGRIEDVDDEVCDLLGYAHAEIVGMHGADLIPPEARTRTAVSIDRMRRGEVARRTGTMQRKDGSAVAVDVESRTLGGGWLVLMVRRRDPS